MGFRRLACFNTVSAVPGHVFGDGETAAILPLELVSDLINSGSEAGGEFLHPQFVQHGVQTAECWGSRLTELLLQDMIGPLPSNRLHSLQPLL